MRGTWSRRVPIEGDPLCTIVETIADRENIPVEELEPLYEAVDPDAAGGLFPPGDNGEYPANSSISFRYQGYDVTVRFGERVVEVTDGSGAV
jgi:hypothetical protein